MVRGGVAIVLAIVPVVSDGKWIGFLLDSCDRLDLFSSALVGLA